MSYKIMRPQTEWFYCGRPYRRRLWFQVGELSTFCRMQAWYRPTKRRSPVRFGVER